MSKHLQITLEVDGKEVQSVLVRPVGREISNVRNRWYYFYALKNKRYEIFITVPSKMHEDEKNYLIFNLNKCNFEYQKPSEHESNPEQ